MIQEWMKLTCKDYVEYIDDLNAQLNQNMIICLRKIWFNTVSPEIIAYIDFLHDTSISVNSLLTIKQIKEWFYDGEVLTDGCSHGVYVRVFQNFSCRIIFTVIMTNIICPWAKMRSNRLYKKLSLIKKTASYGVSF